MIDPAVPALLRMVSFAADRGDDEAVLWYCDRIVSVSRREELPAPSYEVQDVHEG